MQTAHVYVRLSDDRGGGGLGVARQERDCRDLAERLGLEVVMVHVDNDISAFSGKHRPGYAALLDAMRAGTVGTVIAWHNDRLHRAPIELEEYITVSELHGTPTATVTAGSLDLSTPSGRMVARMLGSAARYESEHKSTRQLAKHLEIARAGRASGGIRAFGYDKHRREIVEPEAAVLRDCASRLLAGESLKSVCNDLNAREVPTVRGGPWKPTVLRMMITRPGLAGVRVHLNTNYPAAWPPILDTETHAALVDVFTDPRRKTSRGSARVYLLSGIVRCDEDGTAMTTKVGAQSRPALSRVAYACPTCNQSVAQAHTDEMVTVAVVARLAQPDIREAMRDGDDTSAADLALIQDCERRKDRIRDAWETSGEAVDWARRKIAQIDEEAAGARRRFAARARGNHLANVPVIDRESFDDLPLDIRRELVRVILPDLVVRRPATPGRRFDFSRVLLDGPETVP